MIELHLHFALFETAVSLLVSAALTAASYFLLRPKKAKKPHANQADIPVSTTATQGSYVPLLVGRRRVGAIVAWVGDRKAKPVYAKTGGGKGRSKKKRTGEYNYSESRWDLLCVGPASVLRRIWQDGRVVFNATHLDAGGLTPEEYPSGTLIQGGGNGDFYIFWGEGGLSGNDDEPPINTLVADTTVAITSRWPHVCAVFWIDKPLGTVPRWPQLDYDLEVFVQGYVAGDEE